MTKVKALKIAILLGVVIYLGNLVWMRQPYFLRKFQRSASANHLLKKPFAEMPNTLEAMYRLSPDKRLALTVKEIFRLAGKSEPKIRYKFGNNQWQMSLNSKVIAKLPEFPRFKDIDKILTSISKVALKKTKPLNGTKPTQKAPGCHSIQSKNIVDTLIKLEDGASLTNPSILSKQLRCLTLLALQTSDSNSFSDNVVSKALAISYVYANASKKNSIEKSALAQLMGDYNFAAESVKKFSTSTDPLYLYLKKDIVGLKSISGDLSAYFLSLLSMQEENKSDAGTDSIAQLNLIIQENIFGTSAKAAEVLAALVQVEAMAIPVGKKSTGQRLNNLYVNFKVMASDKIHGRKSASQYLAAQKSIDRLSGWSGKILDAKTLQSFYLNHLYSSAYTVGSFYIHQYNSIPYSEKFRSEELSSWKLVSSDAAFFDEWYRIQIDYWKGKNVKSDSLKLLSGPFILGTDALKRTQTSYKNSFNSHKASIYSGLHKQAKILDARPKNREYFADEVLAFELDINYATSAYRSLIPTLSNISDSDAYIKWIAYGNHSSDLDQILKIALSPVSRKELKLSALYRARFYKLIPEKEFLRQLESLSAKYPDDFKIATSLFDSYSKRAYQDIPENEKVAGNKKLEQLTMRWLRTQEGEGLQDINVYNYLATSLWRQKKFKELLKVTSESVKSGQGMAIYWHAVALHANGNVKEAWEMAKLSKSRYPNSYVGIMPTLKLGWETGKYDLVGQELLALYRMNALQNEIENMAAIFHSIFKDKPTKELIAAYMPIAGIGMANYQYLYISDVFFQRGSYKLASFLASLHPNPNAQDSYSNIIRGYRYMKKLNGKEKATAWLKSQFEPADAAANMIQLFNEGDYALLWDLTGDAGDNNFIWIPRIMAYLEPGWSSQKYKDQLINKFKNSPTRDLYDLSAKYMLGLMTKKDYMAQAESKDKERALLYLGLKAEADGRLEEACQWFRLVLETDETNTVETYWAQQKLKKYHDMAESFFHIKSSLAKQKQEI